MSSYMKGFSKRKPYLFPGMSVLDFFRSPVRHLLESLERESALEKPYLEFGPPQQKHLRIPARNVPLIPYSYDTVNSANYYYDVEYNPPTYTLYISRIDCDLGVEGSITKDGLGSPLYAGEDKAFYSVSCNNGTILVDSGSSNVLWWDFEGRISDYTETDFKCIGKVILAGKWVKTERKVISLEEIITSTILVPGINVGGVLVADDSKIKVTDVGVNPFQPSFAGTPQALAGMVYREERGNRSDDIIHGTDFTRALPFEWLEEKNITLNWMTDAGKPTSYFPQSLWTNEVEESIDVSCDCEDYQSGTAHILPKPANNHLTADSWNTVYINGSGKPPYTWTAAGCTFSSTVTTGTSNSIYPPSSVGFTDIIVTDSCGFSCHNEAHVVGGVYNCTGVGGSTICGSYYGTSTFNVALPHSGSWPPYYYYRERWASSGSCTKRYSFGFTQPSYWAACSDVHRRSCDYT